MQLVEATRDAQQAAEGDARLVADVRMVHLRCGGGSVRRCGGAAVRPWERWEWWGGGGGGAVRRCGGAAVLHCG